MNRAFSSITAAVALACWCWVGASAKAADTARVPDKAFLFSYFTGNGEDGLHLAWSRDGYHWERLNGGKSFLRPEVGESKLMRDPCLLRGPDGTFHLVWTTSWKGQDHRLRRVPGFDPLVRARRPFRSWRKNRRP